MDLILDVADGKRPHHRHLASSHGEQLAEVVHPHAFDPCWRHGIHIRHHLDVGPKTQKPLRQHADPRLGRAYHHVGLPHQSLFRRVGTAIGAGQLHVKATGGLQRKLIRMLLSKVADQTRLGPGVRKQNARTHPDRPGPAKYQRTATGKACTRRLNKRMFNAGHQRG